MYPDFRDGKMRVWGWDGEWHLRISGIWELTGYLLQSRQGAKCFTHTISFNPKTTL